MKRILKKLLNNFYGKKKLQNLYEKLYYISLKGMNYVSAGNYEDNGERFTIEKIKGQLDGKESITIFDIGANIGNYTESLLKEFKGSNIKIHSFEPAKNTYSILKSKYQNNKKVTTINSGISDIETSLTLYGSSKKSTLSSLYERDIQDKNIKFDISEEIELTTIDLYCKINKIDEINFLKLDIEGHELNALRGAKKLMADNGIQFIQFEFGGCNVDARIFFKDIYMYLTENYNIFRILKDGFYPIKVYDTKLEIFQSSNYLAVNKNIVLDKHFFT